MCSISRTVARLMGLGPIRGTILALSRVSWLMDSMTDVSKSDRNAGMMAMPTDEFIPACNQVKGATSLRIIRREIIVHFADDKDPASVDALPMGKQGTLQSPWKKMIREERGSEFQTFSDQISPSLIWQQLATAGVLKCADFRRKTPSNTIYNILNTNEMRIC